MVAGVLKIKNKITMTKYIIAAFIAIFLSVGMVNAQTYTLAPSAFEGKMALTVEASDLDAADTDSTTFVDWTPINTSSTIYYLIQTMTSARAPVQDSVTVFVFGYTSSLSPPIIMDTITFNPATGVSTGVGTLSISSSIIPNYIGLRFYSANSPEDRRVFFMLTAPYVSGVSPSDIRDRITSGRYGN